MGWRGGRVGNVTLRVVNPECLFNGFHFCFLHGIPVALAEVNGSQTPLPLLSGLVEMGTFYATTRCFNGGAGDAAGLMEELVSFAFHFVSWLFEPLFKVDPELSYSFCLCLFTMNL